MAQVTTLHPTGIMGVPYAFVAKTSAVGAVPDMPGLEHIVEDERLHHLVRDTRLHHHVPDSRLHFTVQDEDI